EVADWLAATVWRTWFRPCWATGTVEVELAPAPPGPLAAGTGSKATQPSRPSSTSGHTVASEPVTTVCPRARSIAPGEKPTARRLGRPALRTIRANALAYSSSVPVRVEAKAARRAQLEPGVA